MKHIKDLLDEYSPKVGDSKFVVEQFIKKLEEVVINCIKRGDNSTSIKLFPTEKMFFKELKKEAKNYGICLEFDKETEVYYISWDI